MSKILKVRDWLRNEKQLSAMTERRQEIISKQEKYRLLEGLRGQNLINNSGLKQI